MLLIYITSLPLFVLSFSAFSVSSCDTAQLTGIYIALFRLSVKSRVVTLLRSFGRW